MKSKAVLVIEDNEADAFLVEDLLCEDLSTCYQVDWACGYEAGFDALVTKPFDVCLLDQRLGARTGLELLSAYKAIGGNVPIILLTGMADRKVDQQALADGAADYLVKQEITASLLERSIRYALERQRLLNELAAAARFDPLTGLANRRYFLEFVEGAMSRARRSGTTLGILFADLDGLKQINDELGHDAGDAAIRHAAGALSSLMRRGDHVARLGGDEFAVVADDIGTPASAASIAQKLLDGISEPLDYDGVRIAVSASIGIATYAGGGQTAAEIVKLADAAMYRAKQSRSRFQFAVVPDPAASPAGTCAPLDAAASGAR